MRILIVVNVFAPDRAGGAAVFTDLAVGLAERGHEVDVWCAYPYYPEWTDKSGRNRWGIDEESLDGVRVQRHWLWIPRNPSSIVQRLLYEASFFVSVARRSGWKKYDVVLAFVPLLGGAAAALFRANLVGVPVILDVQDLPAEAATAAGLIGGRARKVFQWVQRTVFSRAGHLVTISPVMAKRMREAGAAKPITVVPNWLNASAQAWIDRLPRLTEHGPQNRSTKLLYAGNIGGKQGLRRLVAIMMDSDLTFNFAIHGEGSDRTRLENLVKSSGDLRFSVGPFLPEDEFLAKVNECEWFVIPERDNRGASFIPSKLIPVISTGTPILAITSSDSPLAAEVLAHSLGVVVAWKDLGPALGDILGRSVEYADACLARAKRYHRSVALTDIEGILTHEVRRKRHSPEMA